MKKAKKEIKVGDLIMIKFLSAFEEYEKPQLYTTTAKKTVNIKDYIFTTEDHTNSSDTVRISTTTNLKFVPSQITTTISNTFVPACTNVTATSKFFTSNIVSTPNYTSQSAINTPCVNFSNVKNIICFHNLQNIGEIDNVEFLYEYNFDEGVIRYTEMMEPFIRALVIEIREVSTLGETYFSKKFVDPHNQKFQIPKSEKFLRILVPSNKVLWIKQNESITSKEVTSFNTIKKEKVV